MKRLAFMTMMIGLACASGSGDSRASTDTTSAQTAAAQPGPSAGPIFIVYYWRARPGKAASYSEYIRKVAVPIDEAARKAGVFEEVHTFTPALVTGAPGSDWTHMRVFKLRNVAAWDGFGPGLDEAARQIYPDEAKRREAMSPAAELRDLVRQEIWREFR